MDPIVPCEELARHLDDPRWHVFDCRTRLGDPSFPRRAYAEGHIPGAVVAHMEEDLSDPVGDGLRGRHPLPSPERFHGLLARAGVRKRDVVVAYDDEGGWWASRMWWLCRDRGVEAAVLDGGWRRWQALGLPTTAGEGTGEEATGDPRPGAELPGAGTSAQGAHPGAEGDIDVHWPWGRMPTVAAEQLPPVLLDARVAPRFRGETEPVDPVAGHIPGARNVPAAALVGPDMRILPRDGLRARFEAAGVGAGPPTESRSDAATGEAAARAQDVACYCGSGVTATFLVLAMEQAGLPTPALYPGSWSSWIAEGRPIETGP